MFCVNCGKAYEPSFKFCNHCGHPLPLTANQSEPERLPEQAVLESSPSVARVILPPDTHNDGQALASEPVVPTPPSVSAPYAKVVSLLIGYALFVSLIVFNVAAAFTRNSWDSTISTSVATVAAVFLGLGAVRAWRQVVAVEPDTGTAAKQQHRRILRNSAIIISLFFVSAGIVGNMIGQNRAEAAELNADLEKMSTIGGRISKARNAVESTIPSYVQMYRIIEPDVQELEPTFRRLKTELALYDGKFPAQHQTTSQTIANMDVGIRRMELLKQQIEVARQIEALESARQFAAWTTQMQPLLDSEDTLNKAK
jgi:hypothetical protein